MSEQLHVLKDVAYRLNEAGIFYMVSGSVAMNYYAQPRMTRDIDVVVELKPKDATKIEKRFAEDYYLDIRSIRTAISQRGQFNLIQLEHVVKVDFIIRRESEYRRVEFSRRRGVDLGGAPLSIVSPEDLILSKLDWARESRSEFQFMDVRNLIASVSDLDWEYLQTWAASLGVDHLLKEVTA